jgi:hypothetical protein
MFIELPTIVVFPWDLLAAMVVMAMLTTIYAVYVPVKKVNNKEIA